MGVLLAIALIHAYLVWRKTGINPIAFARTGDAEEARKLLETYDPSDKEFGQVSGMLLRAHGMGFDSEGRLFVVDVDNFRVNLYAHDGEFLRSWGRAGVNMGELNAPHGLFVDPSGDVFVTSYYGPTQKFDPEGHLLAAFAYADPPDGPVNFHAVVGDRWGDVYLMVRTLSTPGARAPGGEERQKIDFVKLNNSGDYVTAWALSEPDRHGAWAVVDDDGTVYALFRDETHAGIEIFAPA